MVLLGYLEACWPSREVVVADVEVVVEVEVVLGVVVVAKWDFDGASDQVLEVVEDQAVHPELDFAASFVVDLGFDYVRGPSMGPHCRTAVDHWSVVLKGVRVVLVHCGT
jgi:hypothetical protein